METGAKIPDDIIPEAAVRKPAVQKPAAWSRNRLIGLVVVILLTFVAIFPASPWRVRTPNTDSAIFTYIGRQILDGKLPYRDAYDHKPPLIFYLDAVGLALGGGHTWGIWVLQVISLMATALIAFRLLDRHYGLLPAVVATCAMLLNLAFVHERGNLTEEYALPLQFGAVLLLSSTSRAPKASWRYFFIGLLLGLASTLKQPMAGIGVGIGVYLLIAFLSERNWKGLLAAYGWLALGAVMPWLFWFAYYAAVGILPEYWEAAFLMNFGVSSLSNPERLQSMQKAFLWLTDISGYFSGGMLIWLAVLPILLIQDQRVREVLLSRWMGIPVMATGLVVLSNGLLRNNLQLYALVEISLYRWAIILIGLLLLLIGLRFLTGYMGKAFKTLFSRLDAPGQPAYTLLVVVALVDFPVAFLAGTLTGRAFAHYFMPLLPSMTFLLGFAVYCLFPAGVNQTRRAVSWAWLVVLMIPVFFPALAKTVEQMGVSDDRQVRAVAQYIQEQTRPGDPVYQWGISTAIYELAGRTSPTRFFFGNTLFFDGYSGIYHTSRLLNELKANPPVLIVDPMMARLPLVTVPGWKDCERAKDPAYYQSFVDARRTPESVIPLEPEGMGDVYVWICENYAPEAQVGELGWMVYRLKGK